MIAREYGFLSSGSAEAADREYDEGAPRLLRKGFYDVEPMNIVAIMPTMQKAIAMVEAQPSQ